MATRTCKRCSYSQESKLSVCLRCGAPLPTSQDTSQASERSATKETNQRSQQTKPKAKPGTQRSTEQKPNVLKPPNKDSAKKTFSAALNLPERQDLVVIGLIIFVVVGLYFVSEIYDDGQSPGTTSSSREVRFVETIPSENSTAELTVTEHNFCAAEERRLEEMSFLLETLHQIALYIYYSRSFDEICENNRTVAWRFQEARTKAARESDRFSEEARQRIAGNPLTDRDHQIFELLDLYVHTGFVIVDVANVRSEPNINASRVTRLEAMHEILQFGESEDGWIYIMFFDQNNIKFGYIADRLVRIGPRQVAWETHCELDRSQRPASGHVFNRIGTGHNSLTVSAGNSDQIVKLRDYRGDILTFFVRANETAWVADVPDGVFDVLFASGTKFSSKCVDFLGTMNVIGTRTPIRLQSRRVGQTIHYTEQQFDLQQQMHGNFNPRTFTADDFRQ